MALEALTSIQDAEKQASRILEEAQKQAGECVASAAKQARDQLAAAQQEMQREFGAAVKTASEKAEKTSGQKADQIRQEAARLRDGLAKKQAGAMDIVLQTILEA